MSPVSLPPQNLPGAPDWWVLERVEIKRALSTSESFAFSGRAVAFFADGDAGNKGLPDTNASTGTVEIQPIAKLDRAPAHSPQIVPKAGSTRGTPPPRQQPGLQPDGRRKAPHRPCKLRPSADRHPFITALPLNNAGEAPGDVPESLRRAAAVNTTASIRGTYHATYLRKSRPCLRTAR